MQNELFKLLSTIANSEKEQLRRIHPPLGDADLPGAPVVLFIHGLGGDCINTWRHKDVPVDDFFLNWIGEDTGFEVWTLGYNAPILKYVSAAMSLDDRRLEICDRLAGCQHLRGRKIVLVGHSMGGLLIKKIVVDTAKSSDRKHKQFVKQIVGIVLIAVPNNGSHLANLLASAGRILAINSYIWKLKRNAGELADLNEGFVKRCQSLRLKQRIKAFRETLGFRWPWQYIPFVDVMVVDDSSGDMKSHGIVSIPVNENHYSISKPKSKDARLYQGVREFLKDCKRSLEVQSKKSSKYELKSISSNILLYADSNGNEFSRWLSRFLKSCNRNVFFYDPSGSISSEAGYIRGESLQIFDVAFLIVTQESINSGILSWEYSSFKQFAAKRGCDRKIVLNFSDCEDYDNYDQDLKWIDCRSIGEHREWLVDILETIGIDPNYVAKMGNAKIGSLPRVGDATLRNSVPEFKYIQEVLKRIRQPGSGLLLVTIPGRRYHENVIAAFLREAKKQYDASRVFHIRPSFLPQSTEEEGFNLLGYLNADEFIKSVTSDVSYKNKLLIVVSGFESSNRDVRTGLAFALRKLNETLVDELRIVLFGGYNLVEQKFALGEDSYLSSGEVVPLPNLTVSDVLVWQANRERGHVLSSNESAKLLDVTGGQAALVRHCLDMWAKKGPPGKWHEWCLECKEVLEDWERIKRQFDLEELRITVKMDSFGTYSSWPSNPITRALLYSDMLAAKTEQDELVWRSPVVREVARRAVS